MIKSLLRIDIHLLPFRFSPKEYWETYTNEVINYLAFWQQPHADIWTETNHWEALTDVCETGHCTSGSVEHRHLATGLEPITYLNWAAVTTADHTDRDEVTKEMRSTTKWTSWKLNNKREAFT